MSHNNAHIITRMDAILNKKNTRPGVNFKALEQEMISGGLITKTKEPQDRFNDELRRAASKLGLSFGELVGGDNPTKSTQTAPPNPIDYEPQSLPSVAIDAALEPPEQPDDPDIEEDEISDEEPEPSQGPSSGQGSSPQSQGSSAGQGAPDTNRFAAYDRPRFGPDLRTRTQEQERRAHIDSVIGNDGISSGFSFENEKREDIKCSMLADIDSLLSSLSDEGVDLSRIPSVTRNSSFEEVESVLKLLRHKNDHARCHSFAEEFLIFGACALEELFDGKRKWFGKYQPDLTGWHNHVNVKISRMRHDTSKIVSDVMQDYNIGPGARILLELIPSMVVYSKTRKQQYGEPGLFSDMMMRDASANVQNLS